MHSVTKFLMAFAAVLCVFLSAMVIAYAANTDRILADYGNEQASRRAADAALSAGSAQWTTQQADLMRNMDDLKRQLQAKDGKLAELENERAMLNNDRAEAQRARDSYKSRVDEFAAIIKTNQTLIERYSKEVSDLRSNEMAYRTRALETEERLANLLGQVDVLQANNRALQEAMHDMQKGAGVAMGTNAGLAPFEATAKIFGRVESVQTDPSTKKVLVKINVGSNSGASNNMIFRVVRGNEFIANLAVVKTDLAFSIAEVTLLQKDVQIGDEVRTRLQ